MERIDLKATFTIVKGMEVLLIMKGEGNIFLYSIEYNDRPLYIYYVRGYPNWGYAFTYATKIVKQRFKKFIKLTEDMEVLSSDTYSPSFHPTLEIVEDPILDSLLPEILIKSLSSKPISRRENNGC